MSFFIDDLEVRSFKSSVHLNQLPGWWRELAIVNLDITLGHLIETLQNDAD